MHLQQIVPNYLTLEAIHASDLLSILQRSNAQSGQYGDGPLSAQPVEVLQQIIDHVTQLFPTLKKYVPFIVNQIATGKILLWNLDSDVQRITNTITAFMKASKTKEWTGSRDLYSYKNWRDLEKVLIDTGAFNSDFAPTKEEHSQILFTRTYTAPNAALMAKLLGGETNSGQQVTFWLRKMLTVYGCTKYGKGTQWCTSGDSYSVSCQDCNAYSSVMVDHRHPEVAAKGGWVNGEGGWHIVCPKCQSSNVRADHATDNYLKDGLFIIEKQDARPRRPIIQFSQYEIKGVSDIEISRAGKLLARFIIDVIKAVGNEINDEALSKIHGVLENIV